MRHQKKGFKLGRTQAHRKVTLAALSNALITHKRITTTLAKAKALRMYVEPILNRAKNDSMHSRRQVFRRLQDKHAVTELFGEVAEKIASRPGGYTRIVKLGQRAGDAAEMAIIELVDYNDSAPEGASKQSGRRRTRRSRRKKSSTATQPAPAKTTQDSGELEEKAASEQVSETELSEDEDLETAGEDSNEVQDTPGDSSAELEALEEDVEEEEEEEEDKKKN